MPVGLRAQELRLKKRRQRLQRREAVRSVPAVPAAPATPSALPALPAFVAKKASAHDPSRHDPSWPAVFPHCPTLPGKDRKKRKYACHAPTLMQRPTRHP